MYLVLTLLFLLLGGVVALPDPLQLGAYRTTR